jgi:dynein heavy chain
MMKMTLKQSLGNSVSAYEEKPREQWIFDWPAQISLAGTQIWWTTEVNVAFGRLEEGYENALKDYYKKQVNQLTGLIQLIQGPQTPLHRQMIMSICTLDVHARDIVAKLIAEKADTAQCFSWQSQLRLKWDDVTEHDCLINICDAHFRYNYEYLGNTPRLVVTALTDRCYITLTQVSRKLPDDIFHLTHIFLWIWFLYSWRYYALHSSCLPFLLICVHQCPS